MTLTVAILYPELLGTYGDGGNGLVLAARARRRGMDAVIRNVALSDSLPNAQIFLLGGGEDGPQQLAVAALQSDNTLAQRISDGAVLLAVCAGLQLIGEQFAVAGDQTVRGLGLVDLVTTRGAERRVGPLLTQVDGHALVGFENHGGESRGSPTPLGTVRSGFGNDGVSDGVNEGHIVATYAHGPVLAMNPWLADHLLELALGQTLEPFASPADELHDVRVRAVAQSAERTP